MKKFLSFLLAVLMIVGVMVPMLTLLVSAEGGNGGATVSEMPGLVITELFVNGPTYSAMYNTLNGENISAEAKAVGSSMLKRASDINYAPVQIPVGQSVSGYYEKKMTNTGGVVTFAFENASGTAKAGTQYYKQLKLSSVGEGDIFEFIEIYNSGTTAVNLYDYRVIIDPRYAQNGDLPTYIDIDQNVTSTAHGKYFQKAGNITAFEEGVNYYWKVDQEHYQVVPRGTAFDPTKTYCYEVDAGDFIENPTEAVLQPGQVALLINFTEGAWCYNLSAEVFQQYFATKYSHGGAFEYDWDNILMLAVDANNSTANRYEAKVKDGVRLDRNYTKCYGIAPKADVAKTDLDTVREEKWTSWVMYTDSNGSFFGKDSFVLQSVTPNSTIVTGGNYLVYDETTNEYVPVKEGTDAVNSDGTARGGVNYYKSSLRSYWNAYEDSTNYVYGMDASLNFKEGKDYQRSEQRAAWSDSTPGVLSDIQAAALPNYAKNPQGYAAPQIAITEVMANNGDTDPYEYVEIVNTSGTLVNVFDYSFVARSSSYYGAMNHYFNKINTIIPGDYGTILAAYNRVNYQDDYEQLAPTNVNYQNGWLQPGEAAVLWAFNVNSYAATATFDSFRQHYGIDESVKVFAMDADCSSLTGRQQRQDLPDSGELIYGIISNKKLVWRDGMYLSEPIIPALTYANGATHPTNRGIPLSDCESFVLCSAHMVSCDLNNPMSVGYAYQYVPSSVQGSPNRLSAYLRTSYAAYSANNFTDFLYTGSVVTDAWKPTPGKLLQEQMTEAVLGGNTNRYVVYLQEFNAAASGYSAVAQKLGITGTLAENWEATANGGKELLEVVDGKLQINNRTASVIKLTLMSDNALALEDLIVEYSVNGNVVSSATSSDLSVRIDGTDLVLTVPAFANAIAYDYITVYTDCDTVSTAKAVYGNGFEITEYHTPEGNNAVFKAIEVTNISDISMNLYEQMIVSTDKTISNGQVKIWNNVIKLAAGCPVSKYDVSYNYLKQISNPRSCTVKPGESVVIWLLKDIENHVVNNTVSLNVQDFRDYYGEDLGAEVKVVVAYDRSSAANTAAYGLVRDTAYYSNLTQVANSGGGFAGVFTSTFGLQSKEAHSLGYISADEYGAVAALDFVHVGEIAKTAGGSTNVINVYFHKSVMNGLDTVQVKNTEASVSHSAGGASVSFKASVASDYYNLAVELFGENSVKCGILVARADAAMNAQALRPYFLDAAGVDFEDEARMTNAGTRKALTSTAQSVDAGYYSLTYSAVAFVTVETDAFGAITKYADSAYHQSAKQATAAAMMTYLTTSEKNEAVAADPNLTYYEISAGKWSLYTREQIERLNVLCK